MSELEEIDRCDLLVKFIGAICKVEQGLSNPVLMVWIALDYVTEGGGLHTEASKLKMMSVP